MNLLTQTKPRKSKFGFKARVQTENFIQLGEAYKLLQELDKDGWLELNFNMSANEFKLYTNDENAFAEITKRFC